MLFTGSYTALLTPFKNGEVDYDAYRKLVDFQIDNGTHGLVPVGTTGESPTLSHDEHKKVIEVCIEQANGRVPIIAGAGSNSTAEAIEFVKHACDVGADGLLVVTPYCNKPTQAGLLAHYTELANVSSKPIIIYDIPGRSVIGMTDETMAKLAEYELIVGVKDATADLGRPTRLFFGLKGCAVPCLKVTCLRGFVSFRLATCPMSCAPLSSRYSVSFLMRLTGLPFIFSFSSFVQYIFV